MSLRIVASCLLLLLPTICVSQESTLNEEKIKEILFSILNGGDDIEIEYGYQWGYENNENEEYYRIKYEGDLLFNQGDKFVEYASNHGELSNVLEERQADGSQQRTFSITYENGIAAVGGGLLEAVGLKPLNLELAGIGGIQLRGTGYLGSDSSFNNVNIALGVETSSFHLPFMRDTGWSNWVVFGVSAQRKEMSDSVLDENYGVLTYRAFLGKHLLWATSSENSNRNRIRDAILTAVPTYEDAVVWIENYDETIGDGIPSDLASSIKDILGEIDTSSTLTNLQWQNKVREFAAVYNDPKLLQVPILSIYLESTGYHEFERELHSGPSLKNMFTATLDYRFVPGSEDIFLRLRYENGYERALDGIKNERLMLTLGLEF